MDSGELHGGRGGSMGACDLRGVMDRPPRKGFSLWRRKRVMWKRKGGLGVQTDYEAFSVVL